MPTTDGTCIAFAEVNGKCIECTTRDEAAAMVLLGFSVTYRNSWPSPPIDSLELPHVN